MVANEPVRLDTPLDALTDMRRGNLALGRVSPDTWTNLNTVLALVEPSEAGGRPGPHFHGALVKRRPQVDIALDTDFMRFAHELAETEPNARTAASTLEKWMRAQAGTSRNDDGA